MAYAIDTVVRGAGPDAHLQLLDVLRALAENAGWTTLRYDTSIPERELILRSTGTTGEEEITVGFKARGRQLQADDEQHHHHADLGGIEDAVGVLDESHAVRPQHRAGDQVGQHRAQPETLEQGHCQHGGQQEDEG